MKKDNDWISFSPVSFVRAGSVSVFTLFYGLLRVINIHRVGGVTICGIAVLAWRPSPEYEVI